MFNTCEVVDKVPSRNEYLPKKKSIYYYFYFAIIILSD